MRRLLAVLLATVVAASVVSGTAFGQQSDTATPSAMSNHTDDVPSAGDSLAVGALAGPIDPATYRLGPGDVLLLIIRGQISRNVNLLVGPEGTLLLPDEGSVRAADRTLADVRAEILRSLSRRYRSVELTLVLKRPRTFRVYVTGQVKFPGPLETNGSFRVADVLANRAFLPAASQRRVVVMHTDGTREPCDLQLFLLTGDGALNPLLRDGDVIQVPSATEFVYVEGAVARPGRFELGTRDSVRTLLRMAGDLLPAAAAERMLLVRFRGAQQPESVWVDRDGLDSGRSNLPLADGERFYVYYLPRYRVQHQALVIGDIQRPGMYPIVEGRTRLSEVIGAAGGFQPTADLSAIRVHRGSPAAAEKDPELDRLLRLSRNELTLSEYEVLRTKLSGFREDYRVGWTRLLGDTRLDLVLRDGDIVRVDRVGSSVRVDGEVRSPGLLNYVPGESVADCIAQAGGFTTRAWQGKVRVTRSVTGQTLLARNVTSLDPGDFIWVPERPDVTKWEQTKDLLTALAQVAAIVIAIRSVR